ncbi:MAG TPA: pyridoxal phosphate-dependent aminotransferase family protein [Gemmatimonadaceae bacterium]|nr:pyridoxal phosphate-dependent aminotransferase family protein [Gemmatimonadaceae bacterium]
MNPRPQRRIRFADTPVPAEGQADGGVQQNTDMLAKAYSYHRPEEVKALGLYPYFLPVEQSDATEVMIEGKRRVMVGSNNYLGLTNDPRVLEAASQALRKYGSACTGSRFLNGNTDLHDRLEVELAKLVDKPAALVFPTGYQANLGVISALAGPGDVLLIDKLNHASMVDGATLSGAEVVRFRHGDLAHLEARLNRAVGRPKMVIVDGVFSMEGDLADIPRIADLCDAHSARLVVDDAHGIGVFGETGAGTCEHFSATHRVDLIVGTFSKSFASIGGFVAGDEPVISYLRHNARSLIFSASIPASACATVLTAIEIMREEPERRARLWQNARRMQRELSALGFDTFGSESPIVPVIVGGTLRTFEFWKRLLDAGVFTNPVIAPAVPATSGRIRTSYMATHTDSQLDFVLEAFKRVGREMDLI